jgi:hypothetical protein
MQVGNYTLQNIPALKLLHYAKKEDLLRTLEPTRVRQLEEQARAEDQTFSAKYLKTALALDDAFMEHFRESMLGNEAMTRYGDNYERMTDPVLVAKSRAVRSAMVAPRKGFLGCVATKLDPSDIRKCAQTYDEPQYRNVELVPRSGLKHAVFEHTGNQLLAPSPRSHISYLPRGLKQYVTERPDEYADYIRERKAELEYLKSVKKNANREQREEQQQRAVAAQVAENDARGRKRGRKDGAL